MLNKEINLENLKNILKIEKLIVTLPSQNDPQKPQSGVKVGGFCEG